MAFDVQNVCKIHLYEDLPMQMFLYLGQTTFWSTAERERERENEEERKTNLRFTAKTNTSLQVKHLLRSI